MTYTDIQISKNHKLRTFHNNVSVLDWHCDEYHRMVKMLSGTDWKFQYDNQLPITLENGSWIFIEKQTWHRLIRGQDELILQIFEYN